jgi:precorrin-6B methylase 2
VREVVAAAAGPRAEVSESCEPDRPADGTSPLVEMAMGYFRSRTLCAAARLGIADVLGEGEQTVDRLASACQADPASLNRLLRALASFSIVSESKPGTFVLTPVGAPLRRDAPDSVWAAVVFWADLLADNWSYLTESVRTGRTAGEVMKREGVASRWSMDPEATGIFRAVMGTGPAENYMPLARAWDFSARRVVADLGGGGGALMLAILEAYPEVHGMLVDRQESVARAADRFAAVGLAHRCALVAADLCQVVPPGADVYILKHILHGCTDETATGILRNCRSVIPADGRLLVVEFVLPDLFNRADKELEQRVMSDLNMLAVTGGKERSSGEWKQLLLLAGFEMVRIITVPGESTSIIEAAPVGSARSEHER